MSVGHTERTLSYPQCLRWRRARPANLAADYCTLRSSKASWFSYYQQDHEEDCLTEESHLPLTPLEERVLSPCSDLELDPGIDMEILTEISTLVHHGSILYTL